MAHAFCLPLCQSILCPLANKRPLKLGECREHMDHEFSHGRRQVDGTAHEVANMKFNTHPLELLKHIHAVGQLAERPVQLREDDVISGPQLSEQRFASIAVVPANLAGCRRVHEERHVAQVVEAQYFLAISFWISGLSTCFLVLALQ